MIRLALRTIRFRAVGFTASFVALFVGAVIVMACGGLLETGIRGAVPPQRLAGAPIVVAGDQSNPVDGKGSPLPDRVPVEAGLAAVIGSVPGVAAAVPDAVVPLGNGVTGHGWSTSRLGPYPLAAGRPPAPGEVATDRPVGSTVTYVIRGVPAEYRVSGTVDGPVFFNDTDAARLGQVDDIGVLLAPGANVDQVRARIDTAVAGHRVVTLTGDDRGIAEFPDAVSDGSNLIPVAAVFGGLATTVAIFVVGSTLALLVRQRRREMALLRAIGATPGQLRRMIVAEALAVSLVATGLAVVPAQRLGRWLFAGMSGSGVVPARMAFHEGWIPQVSGAGIALATAVCAAFIAARAAALAKPTDALAEAALQQRWLSWFRLTVAILCLAGATALAIVTATVMTGPVAASTAAPSAMLWTCGVALLAPGLTRVLTAVLTWPIRAFAGTAGALAMTNAKARKVTLAGAITPVMLVTGLAVAMIYLQTAQEAAAQRAFQNDLRADEVISSTAGSLRPGLVAEVAELPGVTGASALVDGAGYLENGGDRTEITLRGADLSGNAVVLAADEPYAVGSVVHLRFGDGALMDMRVTAKVPGQRGFETVQVPTGLMLAHTDGVLSQVAVRTSIGAAALRREMAALDVPGLVVADRDQVLAANVSQDRTNVWVNFLLVGTTIGYAVLALLNTLIAATVGRRREFALQRLIGATRGQIMRMMTVEAVLTALAGVVLGTAVAAGTLLPFGLALDRSPMPDGPLWIYLAVVGGAVGLTFAGTLAPAAAVLRGRPVEAAEFAS